METSREDVGIAIRSAFLKRGTQQRFSLFALVLVSALLLFLDKIETKPINHIRSFIKDVIYRGSVIVTYPSKGFGYFLETASEHVTLYDKYIQTKEENIELKNKISETDFLKLENAQLRKLLDDQITSEGHFTSSRVIIDKQSPYLNSFIINSGSNKKIKNGMAVLHGKNFIGRIVDVNFFSSRILLISDLNSKIPVVTEPSGDHAILSGHGPYEPTLEYLPKNNKVKHGDKVYTSGKEGIFKPGIPIGEVKKDSEKVLVGLFSDLNQITFVNIDLTDISEDQ